MKILGGSFGLSGKVTFEGGNIVINAASNKTYPIYKISTFEAKESKENKFAITSAILGIVIFATLFTFIFGPIGTIVGIVIGIAGSFYSKKTSTVFIKFDDGKSIELSGKKSTINAIARLI